MSFDLNFLGLLNVVIFNRTPEFKSVMIKVISYIITALLIFSCKSGFAQTCCSGGVPISTNLGLPPSLKGTWQFALTYDLNTLNTLKEGTTVIEDNARLRRTHSLILSAGYSVSDRFAMEGLFPYVRQERKITQPGGFDDFEFTQGPGDILLLFKYRITSLNNQKHVLSVGAGPKFATGSSDELNSRGLTLNLDLQPGSGATDLILWSNYIFSGFKRPSRSLYGVITYRSTGVNNNYLGNSSYEIGNNIRILGGVSDQFVVGSKIFSTSAGLRFRKASQDQFEGAPLPSTGGEWLFLIPGFGVSLLPNFVLETNVELPLYSNPLGTQLTPTYRFNLGASYSIGKNELKYPNDKL